jgi:ABC-type sugar transport system permease subunit
MKSGAEVYLSREIDKVPHNRRDLSFAIIFVAEMAFSLFDSHVDFLRPLRVTLVLLVLSYLGSLIVDRGIGSLIVDRGKRFKALYSIAFVLYILLLIRRHKQLI